MRVLYILRHPVERLWPHDKFHLEQSGKRSAVSRLTVDRARSLLNHEISAHSKYGDIVSSLMKLLRRDELLIISFEEFITHPQEVLKKIEAFLGLEPFRYSYDLDRKVNPSNPVPLEEDARQYLGEALQLERLESLGVFVPPPTTNKRNCLGEGGHPVSYLLSANVGG